MSRMLELVRSNSLSWHHMMTASKGALQVPGEEMVEILVYIADHNKIMGEQARMTLAGWDEASAKAIAASPRSPKEVLEYWMSPKNLRTPLFLILLENPSVPIGKLSELATHLKGEWIDLMIASPRVQTTRQLLTDLSLNKELSAKQASRVQELITGKAAVAEPQPSPATQEVAPDPPETFIPESSPANHGEFSAEPPVEAVPHAIDGEADPESDDALVAFFSEHAAELAAEGEKPFHPIGGIHEEMPDEEPKAAAASASAASASASTAPVASSPSVGKALLPKKLVNPEDEKRGSVLQKINKLDIKGRIQLAMKGTKEERSILVRDGTKLVALAVLDSPKISDGEVEKIASQRNVLEAVLRAIPLKRRFMKNYSVVRNLVFNPRTPIDISLGLMKNLLIADLRNLSGNKEISDTVRKLALRNFKQKTAQAGKN
jgi:hypothetical protein